MVGLENSLEKQLDTILLTAAKLSAKSNVFKTPEEWKQEGILLLKRKLLGFWGYNKVLSTNSILLKLQLNNFVNSREEGIKLLEFLEKKSRLYYKGNHLYFTRLENLGSNDYFRVSKEIVFE